MGGSECMEMSEDVTEDESMRGFIPSGGYECDVQYDGQSENRELVAV